MLLHLNYICNRLFWITCWGSTLSEVWFGYSCDRFFKFFGEPQLDHGLAGHAQPMRLAVEGMNHPDGKIHIDPLLLAIRTNGL